MITGLVCTECNDSKIVESNASVRETVYYFCETCRTSYCVVGRGILRKWFIESDGEWVKNNNAKGQPKQEQNDADDVRKEVGRAANLLDLIIAKLPQDVKGCDFVKELYGLSNRLRVIADDKLS